MNESKISLIHATQLAIQPVAAAFDHRWPQAQRMNLLDDRLSQDLVAAGSLNADMVKRLASLAHYATAWGAHGILFTCSAFGPAIDEIKRTVGLPVLKPNEAMFDDALDLCVQPGAAGRIGLLTTFAPAAHSMHEELRAVLRHRHLSIPIESACALGAMDALNAGDAATHDRLVVEHARSLAACDVVMLGQFSMARAQRLVAEATHKPVLTSPDSAVRRLKAAPGLANPH